MSSNMIDPLGILATDKQQTASTKTAETARWENTEVGKCPVCKQPMRKLDAAGIQSYVCLSHHIALPVED